jgi:hypothetical protein
MQPTDVALTLVLGGVDFGVQFRDIMCAGFLRSPLRELNS